MPNQMPNLYPTSEVEERILKRSQEALRYALLCGTGIGAPLFCVLAFRAAAEARHLINQQGRWETLLPRIFAAQLIAASITFSWFLVACAALILILITS
ncbi:MAG: hypothetical protein KA314_30295 [Chloroflexi bacterium]|nr:hypothetical protein [Chloroflexota bacterium]